MIKSLKSSKHSKMSKSKKSSLNKEESDLIAECDDNLLIYQNS